MRIAGWEVRAFGPLTHTAEGLEEHALVVVLGPNESGKTTLCDFVLTGLFGFEAAGSAGRERAPWSGVAAEGALDLVLTPDRGALPFEGHENGQRARVWRRRAGAGAPTGAWMTERSEQELANGAIPPLAGRDRRLAENLAVLDAEALAAPSDAEWERIEERFFVGSHVSLLRSARAAAAELVRAADRLWRPDRRGKPRHRLLEVERDELRRQRRGAVERAARVRELSERRRSIALELASLRRRREALRQARAAERELLNHERELVELDEALERSRRRLFGDAPLARIARALGRLDPAPLGEVLVRCRSALEAREALEQDLEHAADEVALITVELDALAEEQRSAGASPGARGSAATDARRRRGAVALSLGGLAAVGASLDLAEPRVLAAGAALLAAFGLVEFVGSASASATQGERDDLEAQRAELQRERVAAERRRQLVEQRLAAAEQALAALEVERAGWLADLPLRRELSDHPSPDLSTALDELAGRIARASWLRRQVRHTRLRCDQQLAVAAAGKHELSELAAELDEQLASGLEQRGRLDAEISALESEPAVSEIEGALAALDEELSALRDERDELALAAALVAEAVERWRERHTPELFERASHYVSILTAGRWSGLVVRESDHGAGPAPTFGLRAGAGGQSRAIEAPLSRGLRAQVYFALRLALFEELEARERDGVSLPLLIDDAFVDWDPGRATAGIRLLSEIASTRQVLVLTADPALAERLTREAGAHVVELADRAAD